jgi:trans-aconitate 2-methyltransferase
MKTDPAPDPRHIQPEQTSYSSYTFGDHDLAAARLAELSALFQPALLALVGEYASANRPAYALDFGCGPGHTTRALFEHLRPQQLTGLDSSAAFLERARRSSPPEIDYRQQDITQSPFGLPPADWAYSRFLLTHLADPAAALRGWASALAPRGFLLLQETASITSAHPALGRYYELMLEFQRRHGQNLNIGGELQALVDPALYRVVHAGARPLTLSTPRMAAVHAMNLTTWRKDALAQSFDPDELDRLARELLALSNEANTPARVDYQMGELVLERR